MDYRLPYIFMINNAQLKETLSQKILTSPPISFTPFSASKLSGVLNDQITITLNISVALKDAGHLVEQLHALFSDSPSTPVNLSTSISSTASPINLPSSEATQTSKSLFPQKQASSGAHLSPLSNASSIRPLPMTPRQRSMILALSNKKKLTPEFVEKFMFQLVGHGDVSKLSKIEASNLIEKLLAQH